MALESYCAACTYMSESGSGGKYWCERKGQDILANTPRCYNFCEAYSRSNYARQNMYDNAVHSSSSGCYLTTIMCKILKYPDDNYYLNTLRRFRDEVMKPNPKYIPLLLMYDNIGPMIAHELEHDSARKEIAYTFFTHYITPSVMAIENEKYDAAVYIYKSMTEALAQRYNINSTVDLNTEYDYETLGHGKKRTRKVES